MLNLSWFPQNSGYKVLMNPYDEKNFPTSTVCVIDIETNGIEYGQPGFSLVCIGLTEDGDTAKVFFDLRPELFAYLQKTNLIGHSMKEAEIPWLSKYGIKIEQLYFDTKIAAYCYDSARKNNSLKPLLKDFFGIEYPNYTDLTTTPEYIKLACDINNNLFVQRKKGPVLPKKVSLLDLPREITAAYNGSDCLFTYKLWKWFAVNMNAAQLSFYNTIELPTTRLLYKMQERGVKIDTKAVRRIHNETSKARRRAKEQLFKLAGQAFNTNSPKQVLPILQSHGCDVQSTGEDALVQFMSNPLVGSLLEFRKRQKVCSTYTTPLYFNAIKDKEERIHAHFNQNTITGRLSSSDPINLQNQPPVVRECFVAEEGNVLVGGDLSNLELRLPAHFSGDPVFVKELSRPDGDLHTATAKFLFGNGVVSLPEAEFKAKRAKAKTCNFLLTNSGTARGLAQELNCSLGEAEELYKKFWDGYPVMAAWLREEKWIARQRSGISTYFGRWVSLPRIVVWCGDPDCAKKNRYCEKCKIREEMEATAISIRVQGTGGDMVKLAALRLYKDYGYIPVLSVHDELVCEVPFDKQQEAMYTVQQVMQNVVQLRVPLVSKIKAGRSWADCH
jgi:DNA polymerase-1